MNKEVDINRMNYESFVIDYLDGSLDAVETACFFAFLENNPDIKDEIAQLGDVKLITDDTTFVEKSVLKKKPVISTGGINEDNYEEFFIAHYEGDLTKLEEDGLQDFLGNNTDLVDEFKLFGNLQVEPTDVIFKDKKSLKHNSYIGINWYSSVAAAILLFMASWFFLSNQDNNTRNEITMLNKIERRNYAVALQSDIIVKIETKKRQVVVIPQSNNVEPLDNTETIANLPGYEVRQGREVINISPINNKVIDEQLVDSYIYTRIIKHHEIRSGLTTEVFNTELALVEPTDNNRKGILARVFNNQLSKIAQGIKLNRKNTAKSSDPTYVKVIDGGLLVFNTLTGSETSTVKIYNSDGNITGYQIEGREMLLNKNFGGRSSSN